MNDSTLKIPKTIHYCWFGRNEKSNEIIKCIESWKLHSPDYRLIEWNEENFNVNTNPYAKSAYEKKKYAFVSDYARLKVLYEYGGLYLDTDVFLLKPLDRLLDHSVFMGFESESTVNPGLIIGAQKHSELIGELLGIYNNIRFDYKGHINLTTIGEYTTAHLMKKGLKLNGKYQILNQITIYPPDVFNPYDRASGIMNITESTYSVHQYNASWKQDDKTIVSNKAEIKLRLKLLLLSVLGEKAFFKVKYLLG